jgi:hypothetical protein
MDEDLAIQKMLYESLTTNHTDTQSNRSDSNPKIYERLIPVLEYDGNETKNIELLEVLEQIEKIYDTEVKSAGEERKARLNLDNSYESLYNANIACGNKIRSADDARRQSIRSLKDYFGKFIYNRW